MVIARGGSQQLRLREPAHVIGHLFRRGNDHVLAVLHRLDKDRRVHEALDRAGVEPGKAAAEQLHLQPVSVEIEPVEVRDLQLAARGRAHPPRHVHDAMIVKIQARDAVVRARVRRLFLDGEHALIPVKLHDAEALRVLDVVAEDGGIARLGGCDRLAQIAAEAVAVENIVAEDHGAGVAADEVRPDQKRLREPVRVRLHRVGQADAELAPVAEQALEARRIVRRGDDEDVADAREHERRERVVDHGLVVDRQQLLGGHERERVQARAGPAGEDDAFHVVLRVI